MKRYITLAVLALLAVCCERLPDDVRISGIGCREDVLSVSWQAGTCTASILATGPFTATIPDDATWIGFKDEPSSRTIREEGDCSLTFTYELNRSIPRSVEILLECGTASHVLTVNQDGLLEGGLFVEQKNVLAPAEGGRMSAKISTKINASAFTFSASYEEASSTGWISAIRIEGNFVVFDVAPNFQEGLLRHADVTIDCGEAKGKVHVTQYGTSFDLHPIGVAELKALLASGSSLTIDEHYIVSGVVVNDDSEGNGAENRMISVDSPDPAYSSRIMFLQDEDGGAGIKLIFSTDCSDVASRYDRISLDAYGLTLRRETSPVRYYIENVPVTAVNGSVSGEAPAVAPRKISSLSENDLYTLVRLENVEIPVRKGPFVPVDIRFVDIVPAYPMIVRDDEGRSIYMMVNSDCSWSRDGNPMPHGSGSITGVLVYEKSDNFEWDVARESAIKGEGVISDYILGLGDIGNWQIRPVFRSDIDLAASSDDSFSTILYEWGYLDNLGLNLVRNYDDEANVIYPSYPFPEEGDPSSLGATLYCSGYAGSKVALRVCNDFTHLGPYTYKGTIPRPENGNGIFDALGRSAHWYVYGSVGTTGVIYSNYTTSGSDWTVSNGSAWCIDGWSRDQFWCSEFSTANLTADNYPVSVQFGIFNHIGYTGAPRYWSVEWSSDGSNWEAVKQKFSVPDFPSTTARRVWQLPGAKYVTVNLPADAIGRDKVFVRIVPAGISGIGTDSSYYSASSSYNNARYNALNYFSVRCNK